MQHVVHNKPPEAVRDSAPQTAALRRAMLPLNGVRVLACVWIMVRDLRGGC
jgi:hypothetical protein